MAWELSKPLQYRENLNRKPGTGNRESETGNPCGPALTPFATPSSCMRSLWRAFVSGVLTGTLFYQPLSARFAAELFEWDVPEVRIFRSYYLQADRHPVAIQSTTVRVP
jgi:hypothetical protein